ncbi:MAG: class I SAM-dependent methyltransferase [Ignavibacteriaceae bacterium]|jgi:SAM-dependent methyltransferase
MAFLLTLKKYLPVKLWKFGADVKKNYYKWQYLRGKRPRIEAETSKAFQRREKEDFFKKYCMGRGLDIGFGGDLITPSAQGYDFEHGDAQLLSNVRNESYDFVYSSHTLEHLENVETALKNWFRVVKKNGYLILYIPHRDLYEKKQTLPSRFNDNHKHYFLLEKDEAPDTLGILPLIERALTGYAIVYAKECSAGHTIIDPLLHSNGEFSIEVVIMKTK